MIRAAAELFLKQGLGATNPDEIVRASGVQKRQFQHYLKNNQGIVHQVLRCYGRAIETRTPLINYNDRL